MGREDFTWGVLMPLDFTMPTQFHGILSTIAPLDILDILIVAVILYRVYVMLEDTRAITLAKGILVLLGVTVVASYFNLHVISWLLQKSVTLLFVALPSGMEHMGPVLQKLYDTLRGIQLGTIEAPEGWIRRIC